MTRKDPIKTRAREIQHATGVPYSRARRMAIEEIGPAEISAVQWTGENAAAMAAFAGTAFHMIDEEDRVQDPDATAEVLDDRHSTWQPLHVGDWVIRGNAAGIRMMGAAEFRERYEEARTR